MKSSDIYDLILHLNGTQVKQELDKISQKMDLCRRNAEAAFKAGDIDSYRKWNQELAKAQRQFDRLSARSTNIERTLQNLDRATPRQLQQTIKEINRALNSGSVERGSHEWNIYTQGLQEARAELKKIKEEQNAVAQSLPQKLSGIATAFSSIKNKVMEVVDTIGQYVEEHAQMDEHLSNVRKYTGLTTEAVEALNEKFKKMDTRTPREQLNDLAADAGRLGIQSKQDILSFVQAADQINVALGEDLGEGAVKNIGKLAQMFSEASQLGLKQGMLSIGSTINELAQSSSASEAYILEFTNRLAGVATQSGLTASQVMGLASVMDQNAVNVEKGATALQNVLVALYQQPQKMARAAGLEVKEFTRLLSTDANAALQQFLSALNQKGGMDRLAPILKEMNLSGAGVTQTLTTLAAHLDDLRQAQDQATTAFRDGTSCTNEAAIANNTLQAQIDRARKHLADLRDELGKRLTPIYLQFLTHTGSLAEFLSTLVQKIATVTTFIATHTREIAAATAAIVTFTAAMKAQAIAAAAAALWHKTCAAAVTIYTTATQGATAATRVFNAAIRSNGLTAFASAILAAIAAFATYTLSTAHAATATRNLTDEERARQAIHKDNADLNQRVQQSMAQEVTRVRALTTIIHDNTLTLAERRRAIAQLRQIIPAYNADITAEGRLTRENSKAINDYTAALRRKYILQAAQAQFQAIGEEQFYHEGQQGKYQNMLNIRLRRLHQFEQNEAEAVKRIQRMEAAVSKGDLSAAQFLVNSPTARKYTELRTKVKEAQDLLSGETSYLSTLDRRLQNVQNTARRVGVTINELLDQTDPLNTTTSSSAPTTVGASAPTTSHHTQGSTTTTTTTDPTAAALERIRQENAHTRAALQVQADQNLTARQAVNEQLLQADIHMYEQIQALYKADSTEYLQAQHQRNEAQKKLQAQQASNTIQALQAQEQVEQNQLTAQYTKQDITQKQYEQQKLQVKLKYLQLYIQKATQADDQDARARYQREYDELYQSGAIDRVKDFWNRVDIARAEWLAKTPQEQQQDELDFAAILKAQGVLTPEEYEKALQYINEKYKKPQDTTTSSALNAPTDQLTTSLAAVFKQLTDLEAKKREGTATWQDYAAVGIASITMLNSALSQTAQLISAQSQLEQNRVTKAYDAQIKAAGNNTRRTKQLEEQKQRELARIKTKYNNRATRIQIASAIAQTAQNAVLAYGYVVKFAGPIAAAIAAAAAIASGMIQVATIRKQAAAQETGYYRGGYTGGHDYHRPAGIVHQGEFVVAHEATQSPAIAPLLQLIDRAQRSGHIAQLTPEAVALAAAPILPTAQLTTSATRSAILSTPAPNITIQPTTPTDTPTQAQTLDLLQRLTTQLDEGIRAHVVLSELDHQYRRYNNLTKV